ncbi:MAG TPA: restriction endonuclease [Candidatus Limosilactobacillus merdigallinarum]|uniref:Restriction endonuclease n=1 Tax=Candidatus Limosilactobacillus merdigallinarum TaxID=2838652 RepID=A0A9D1VJA9_9LACO|nr:restriction endonuclease [Candidatus Limosilactobacillus merdigallinarum]
MLIAEAFKFDAILAAYNRYKDDSENENSDNFLNQFVDSSYKELLLPEPESSKYPPVLKYDKLAYISYVLYKQGSHLKFSSLDDLYELILKKKEEKIQHSLLADNDPEEFNSHANTEYLSTGSNNGSPFSSIPDIDVVTPYELEQMVKEQFTSMGYEAVATKKSGDQGADVIVKESSTGLITVVQVKQYSDSKVGNKAVQEVLAGKEFYDADRAIVMTTSYFTKSATELAEKTDVELMDRDDFLAFMS